MIDYEVIDNFLPEEEHKTLKGLLLKPNFPWYYTDFVSGMNENDSTSNYYFTHDFLLHDQVKPNSHFYTLLETIINKIGNNKLLRIRGNLYPSSEIS